MTKIGSVLWFVIVALLFSGCGEATSTASVSPGPYGTFVTAQTSLATLTPVYTFTPSFVPATPPIETIFDGYFNCRSEPSESSGVIFILNGHLVKLIEKRQGWVRVSFQDQGAEYLCWLWMETLIPKLDQAIVTQVPESPTAVLVGVTFTLPPSTETHEPRTREPNPTPVVVVPPSDTPIPPPTEIPRKCNDGKDNDRDGETDYPDDRQCRSPDDNSEEDD